MFCPQCKCEFVGWSKCPDCKVPLIEALPPEPKATNDAIPYETLIHRIQEAGGQVEIELFVTGVRREMKFRFPYQGFGYAWAQGFQGVKDGLAVELTTIDVGRERGWRFPYFGYGYAWEKTLQGELSGNPIDLTAKKVKRERKISFPYRGYGRAWTEEFTGECGDQIEAELAITEVSKTRTWRFPYQGFGFAWPKKGMLRLRVR